jgi:hypothetical protein
MALPAAQPAPLLAPRGGLRLDMPADLISDLELSDCRCVRFDQGVVSKWPGSRRLGANLPLSGAMVGLDLFTLLSGTEKLIGVTPYDGYVYNATTGYWETITKATELEACDSGWTAGTSVTATHDTSVKVRGTASLKLVLDAGRSDGDQLAYKDISSADISAHNSIGFWIRVSAALAAEALEIVLSESNHAAGEKTGTYVECLTTALAADTWTFVRLAKTLTSFDAVVSVSVYANATLASGLTIYLDDVRAYTSLTGADNNYASFGSIRKTTETDLWWILTNGVDPLLKYTGSGSAVLSDLITTYPAGVTSLLAKYVLAFDDYILLLNVTEQGNPYTQRVRWCDTAKPEDYLNGNASYRDLPGPDALTGGIIFRNDYALLLRKSVPGLRDGGFGHLRVQSGERRHRLAGGPDRRQYRRCRSPVPRPGEEIEDSRRLRLRRLRPPECGQADPQGARRREQPHPGRPRLRLPGGGQQGILARPARLRRYVLRRSLGLQYGTAVMESRQLRQIPPVRFVVDPPDGRAVVRPRRLLEGPELAMVRHGADRRRADDPARRYRRARLRVRSDPAQRGRDRDGRCH